MEDWNQLAQGAIDAARAARSEIRMIMQRAYVIQYKHDRSPVTEADLASQRILMEKLNKMDATMPVISEEQKAASYAQRVNWSRFWLIDPLDGTKEFVRGNGEFTINIALIENHRPVIGIIDWPVGKITYVAIRHQGAYRLEDTGAVMLRSHFFANSAKVVISRSHRQSEIDWVRQSHVAIESIDYLGSALKFCRIAEGRNDIYPRLTPNMEWDSAAGHILVSEAGGEVVDFQGRPLTYNKPDLHNNGFVAVGDWNRWRQYLIDRRIFAE